MIKIILLSIMVALALTRSYPLFKQCDPRWGNEQLGTSDSTICQAGCAMSSCAMALAGTGHSFNPSTLNRWLIGNGGYYNGGDLIWGSIRPLGLGFKGKFGNSQIKPSLDAGNVVIMNVRGGGHWVLAYSYSGSTIFVQDSGFSNTSYNIAEVVDGQNSIYSVGSGAYYNLMGKLKNLRSNDDDLTAATN